MQPKNQKGNKWFFAGLGVALAVLYLSNQATGDVIELVFVFLLGVYTGMMLINYSTRIAARNPVLTQAAKEKVKTQALIERAAAKQEIKEANRPTTGSSPTVNPQVSAYRQRMAKYNAGQ